MDSCMGCEEIWMCYEEHKLHVLRDEDGKPVMQGGDYILTKNAGVRCLKDIKGFDDNGGQFPRFRPGARFD